MWSSLIGGVVGGAFGGIPGALVGAALGAKAGKSMTAANQQEASLHYIEDDAGVLCIFNSSFPEGVRLVIRAYDSEDCCRQGLIQQYQDSDGDFVINVRTTEQVDCFYIPYGCVVPEHGELALAIVGIEETPAGNVVWGPARFVLPWKERLFCRIKLWRPFIELMGAVAHAGSGSPTELAYIVEFWQDTLKVNDLEEQMLLEFVEQDPKERIQTLALRLIRRFPDLQLASFFAIMARLALMGEDPQRHYSKTEVVREIAYAYGIQDEDWHQLSLQLGLNIAWDSTTEVKLSRFCTILGIQSNPSEAQILEAYREKVREYHPDKYRHLPQGFQEYAKQQIQQFNEAKAELIRALIKNTK